MLDKVVNVVAKVVETVKPKVETPKVQPQQNLVNTETTKVALHFQGGATQKALLNARFDAAQLQNNPPTPAEALTQIKQLPVPDPDDETAVRAYNQQRAQIADAAVQNATPPSRDDFSGLPPRLAEMEYRDAKTYFDSQISQLNQISTEAKANPTKLPRDAQLPDNTVDPAQVEAEAQQMIQNAGGRDNLDTRKLGEELANVAQTDPGKAWALAQVILGNRVDTDGKGAIKDHDKDAVVEAMINKLSDDDLFRIGNTENGRALLQRSQEHMYAGNSSDNEKQIADRIQQQGLSSHSTLSDTYQGISGYMSPAVRFDPNASPEDVARAIRSYVPMGGEEDSSAVAAFTRQLEQHKNDPQWIQRFYSSLGAEKVGEIISNAVNSPIYTGSGMGPGDAEYMRDNAATIRQSLETLHSAGLLNQSDMQSLVKNIGDNPQVALEIFGKSNDTSLVNDFVKAAVASGGDQTKAAVATMISRLPADRQNQILGSLSQEELNNLMTGAMRAKGEIFDLSSLIESGSMQAPDRVMIGDVTSLMQAAADGKFSSDVKQKLFLAASKALTDDKVNNNFKDNNALRDALSRIFIDETSKPGADNLLVRLASTQNGRLSSDERSALSGFMAFTVFSPNQSAYSNRLASHVKQIFLDAGAALGDPSLTANSVNELNAAQREFKDKYGLDPKLYATMVGGLFKSAQDGLGLMQKRFENDEASRKAAISFFVDMAASLVPGVAGIAAKGVTNGILSHIVDKTTGAVEDKFRGQLKEGAVDFLQQLFQISKNGFLSGDDLSGIGENLAETLPNQVNRSDGKYGVDMFDGFIVGYRDI